MLLEVKTALFRYASAMVLVSATAACTGGVMTDDGSPNPNDSGGGYDTAAIDVARHDGAPTNDTLATDTPVGHDTPPVTDTNPNQPDGASPSGEWLMVTGNHIALANGTPFHGRGADLFDERQCESCSFNARNPDGVNRWADELIDNWHANFIRLLLESKATPFNAAEQQWMNLSDDSAYYQDVQTNVNYMTSKPGVYVLVTLFTDPTMKDNNGDTDSEWPSSQGDTNPRYQLLAEAFYANPHVLFGLTNEPHTSDANAPQLAMHYQSAIDTIRAVEDSHHTPHHIIVVQASGGYARDLTYFVAHPMPGDNIAYEIHPYNPASDFDSLIVQPSAHLPMIIGEYGPANMSDDDIRMLWTVAQAHGVPYIGWSFHARCGPSMLQDTASDGCGLAPGYNFPRTPWGNLLHDHLATPW